MLLEPVKLAITNPCLLYLFCIQNVLKNYVTYESYYSMLQFVSNDLSKVVFQSIGRRIINILVFYSIGKNN